MRALIGTAAFLMTCLGLSRPASAHVPLWAPRVSLSLALDWNKLAVAAISRPKARPAARVGRHVVPKLAVTAAAPAPAQLDVAAYSRVETAMREVVTPHYVEPDVDHRQMFRVLYFSPYTPYLGAWGAILTVETNALLR
ncbi:MAG: hypothetical protein JWM53_5035 [bacterium]|nr:hypothetical protein [bacterium]